MNWWNSSDSLALVGLLLVICSFLGFRLEKWLKEKTNSENDKFIKTLLWFSKFIITIGSVAALCFGCWFIWPAIVTLSSWLINFVIIH